MNTVNHLKGLRLQPLPKRPFRSWIKGSIPALLFSTILGTYLDLLMVGLKLYAFPVKPFHDIFTINILFTLLGLPFGTLIYLFIMRKRGKWARPVMIVLISLLATIFEKISEELGLFVHSRSWSHFYTFIGYCCFLYVVYRFYIWNNDQ